MWRGFMAANLSGFTRQPGASVGLEGTESDGGREEGTERIKEEEGVSSEGEGGEKRMRRKE